MTKRIGWLVVGLLALLAAPLRAQDVLVGSCILTSGSGSPESARPGSVCDLYLDTGSGNVYTKQSGTGNTGWTILPRLAAANIWTNEQAISQATPIFYLTASGAGSNLKNWRALVDATGATFSIQTINDAKSSILSTPLQLDRSTGNATFLAGVTGTAFSGTTANFSSTLGVTGAATFASNVGTSSFVSQTTGWRVTSGGDADFRSAYLDALHAKSYILDLEQASAGGRIETKGVAVLASAFSVPAAGAAVSTVTRSGSTATATTSSVHGFSTGDLAFITGAVQTEYNGLFSITVTDTTHFTYSVVGTPTTPATGSITAAGAALMVVEDLPSAPDMQVFASGDAVVVRSFSRAGGALIIGDAVGVVLAPDTSASGTQTWTFVRTIATPGSLARATSIPAKSLALDYGVSGNGYIESTTIDGTELIISITRASTTATVTTSSAHGYKTGDVVFISGAGEAPYNGAQTITVTGTTTFTYTVAGSPATPASGTKLVDATNGTNAPYVQIVTWATAPTADNKTVRTRFGNSRGITGTSEYGLFAGDFANKRYVRFTDQNAEIVGIPLLLYDGSTNTVKIDPTVPSFAMGSTLPSAFGTGTGIWMGKDSGSYKFRVGNPSGNQLSWDATNLSLTSANLTINSSGITLASESSGSTWNASHSYSFSGASTDVTAFGTFAYDDGAAAGFGLIITATAAAGTRSVGEVRIQSTIGATSAFISVQQNLVNLIGGGLVVGFPTGGSKGAGTINVENDIYKNNTAYTNPDYVFEQWATGSITKYAKNAGASEYAGLLPLTDLEAYVRRHYRFPQISDAGVGIFGRGDVLLELMEQNTLYLFQLSDRIRSLEARLRALEGK